MSTLLVAPGSPDHPASGLSLVSGLEILAAVVALITTCVSVYRWMKSRTFFTIVHDPAKAVHGHLTYADVSTGLAMLVTRAREFHPDVVLGINRGGAIVGGALCKSLDVPFVEILKVNCDLTPAVASAVGDTQIAGRVLITDDACRKGEHMREAVAFVRDRTGVTDIRTMVLLQLRVKHDGPELRAFRGPGADFSAFFTNDASVVLPWDI